MAALRKARAQLSKSGKKAATEAAAAAAAAEGGCYGAGGGVDPAYKPGQGQAPHALALGIMCLQKRQPGGSSRPAGAPAVVAAGAGGAGGGPAKQLRQKEDEEEQLRALAAGDSRVGPPLFYLPLDALSAELGYQAGGGGAGGGQGVLAATVGDDAAPGAAAAGGRVPASLALAVDLILSGPPWAGGARPPPHLHLQSSLCCDSKAVLRVLQQRTQVGIPPTRLLRWVVWAQTPPPNCHHYGPTTTTLHRLIIYLQQQQLLPSHLRYMNPNT